MKFSILLTTLALAEKQSFDSDVSKVMDILVHSLYKTKDIFLRELVSNSADALEKIRLTDSENLGIKIKAESDTRTLVIEDNGVGMTRDELVQNLGTIANSGTSKLIQNPDLIGKFGVGFYSVFLVSDNVTVYSKSEGGDQFVWSSDSKGYTLDKDPNGNTLGRGTRIEIKLKVDAVDFAKPEVLEDILKKHSEFIKFPIYLWKEKTVEKEAVPEKSKEKVNDDGEAIVEDTSDKQEEKPETVVVSDWEQVNLQQPIWLRDPSAVNEGDYTDFFKTHYKQFQAPLKVGHFKIEGQNTFNVLMFIPESVPQSFLTRDQDNTKNSVELFVRRVFISDEFVSFLPNWLNFVKVILDSDDLPLNVNREHIQTHASLKLVQKKIVSKSLDLLMEVAQDDAKYKPVYESYGKALKIGVHESRSTAHVQSKLLDLLRFESTKSNFTSLKAYKERMSENQKQIYFSTGSNTKQARSNPLAERLMAKNLEVLLMIDPIEEYLAQNDMKSYDSIPLQDVVKPGLLLDTDDDEKEAFKDMETKFEPLTKYLKSLLERKLSDVKLAELPPKTSAVIIPGQNGMSPMQERMFVLQNNGKENDPIFKMYLNERKIMQLNADHPIINKLLEMVQNSTDKNKLDNLLKFFYDSCFVASGWEVRSTKGFQARSDKMFRDYLGIEQEQTFSTQGDISGAETAEKADTDKEENGHSEL